MMFAVTLLAACSALVYVTCMILLLTKRWDAGAGSKWASMAAIAGFVLARFFPQSAIASALASLLLIAALLEIVRRAMHPLAAILAALPVAAMLLVVDRPFFPGTLATQFQEATIALLCAPAPLAIAGAAILRRRGT